MIHNINSHISLIEQSIAWAKKYDKESFPFEIFKENRRKLKKIRAALDEKCSAAAYGESQVGKSYLMSSLLSSPDSPFVIKGGDKSYSFIDDINPSGGQNSKIESTGVITRFTISKDENKLSNMVKVKNLSIVDIILLISDSYYNDLKLNPDTVLKYDEVNQYLESISSMWRDKKVVNKNIDEDDIKDICDYIKEVIGNSASNINHSNFCKIIASNIQYIPLDKWEDVFCILWNKNEEMSRLFATLIKEYEKIGFLTEVYVPFDAVRRDKGTLLKIEWLDYVCGIKEENKGEEITTDIYDEKGEIIARNFSKGYLSALISELTFFLPNTVADDRLFLNHIDLLDFPGARSREKYKEQEIKTVLPQILRRGKVAYLFNKYSRSYRISSVLFCHHNDQKTEPTIGETINDWIDTNIGATPDQRASLLKMTDGIAPLFFIATKFNIDLERLKTDTESNKDKLDAHWNRFNTVFPEIIKPNKWLDEWVSVGGIFKSPYFQNIYPLRDFYWSAKNGLFKGYSDGKNQSAEQEQCIPEDYPNYMDNLRNSFLRNEFVKNHFLDPERTWNEVATVNNDGSKRIINDLDKISSVLDDTRKQMYLEQLHSIKNEIYNHLLVYYESEDIEERNKNVRTISGDIRRALSLSVGEKPEIFGKTIDALMINPIDIRKIAYDIFVLRREVPKDFSNVSFIQNKAGINPNDSREENLAKLINWGMCDEAKLNEDFAVKGFTVEDVITKSNDGLSTIEGIVTTRIIEFWMQSLNNQLQDLNVYLKHANEIVFMLFNLFEKLDLRTSLFQKIQSYSKQFGIDGRLPNIIADYASLVLNNFVSSVGRDYINDSDFVEIKSKADACNIAIDFPSNRVVELRDPQNLMAALGAFDDMLDNKTVSADILQKLPLWDTFQRWESLIIIGLLFTSDVSNCNPEANAAIRDIINQCENLYK